MASYAVGIVNYRAYADLDRCLTSIKLQTLMPAAVFVFDAEPDALERARLRRLHPEPHWRSSHNQGFAAGANAILKWASESDLGVDFVLILNPDVELDQSFCEILLRNMEQHPSAAGHRRGFQV